jgi:hypothetical protein
MKNRQLFTKLFWQDAGERIVATVGEFLLVLGGADGANWLTINGKQLLLLSLAGGAASLLKAVVAAAKADTDTASLTVDTKPLQ